MREIKFRFRIQPKIGSEKIVVKCYTIEELAEGCLSHDFPLNFTILSRDQFTGLKDKNGKEIWEGDVILLPGFKEKRRVFMSQGMFCVAEDGSLFPLSQFYSTTEVIGNIYGHPELLGENHA